MPCVRASKHSRLRSRDAEVWLRFVSESLADFSVSKPTSLLCCIWPGCGTYISITKDRNQEMERHIVSLHLPDNLYCPGPECPWRGHREDARKRHIGRGRCGPTPEWDEQRKIYEPSLFIGWILDATISTELAKEYALDFVKERAREVKKIHLWKDLMRYDDKAN
ncbi:hypothetical protein BJV77DRAFT_1149060 [Russula vinacea]|nr:hypothetical protein BJV77DRAFT_1149060 [Russula vinacea]